MLINYFTEAHSVLSTRLISSRRSTQLRSMAKRSYSGFAPGRASSTGWWAHRWCDRSDVDDRSAPSTRSVLTVVDVLYRQAGLSERRCRSSVWTEQEPPPVSGGWLAVPTGESVVTWRSTAKHRNTVRCMCVFITRSDVTGSTVTPSISSADLGSWYRRRLVAHHRTSVLDEFNSTSSMQQAMTHTSCLLPYRHLGDARYVFKAC